MFKIIHNLVFSGVNGELGPERRKIVRDNIFKLLAGITFLIVLSSIAIPAIMSETKKEKSLKQDQLILLPSHMEPSSVPEIPKMPDLPEMHVPPLSSIESLRTNFLFMTNSVTVKLLKNGADVYERIFEFGDKETNLHMIHFVPIKDKKHLIILTGIDGNVYPFRASSITTNNGVEIETEIELVPFGDKKTVGFMLPKGDYEMVRITAVPQGPYPQILITTQIPPIDDKKRFR